TANPRALVAVGLSQTNGAIWVMHMKCLLSRCAVASLLAASFVLLPGCNTTTKTAKPDMVRSEYGPDEYVTVPPETGSHIPKKGKVKDAVAERGSTKSKVEDVDPDEFRRGVRQMKQKPDGA